MSSSSATKYCKLLVLGDGAVGKSSLLIVYSTGTFPREYVPTVFDNYSTDVMVEGQKVTLTLWDTAGQEDYDRLRPLSYPCTDIFFLCFDVSRRASLENIASKWLPEITHHCPGTPAFLVGCKKDVRSSEASQCVSYEDARQVASDLGLPYYETSSLNGEGVNEVFQTAMRRVLYAPGKTKKKGFLPGLPGPQ